MAAPTQLPEETTDNDHPSENVFYLHDDDWGLISIIPYENVDHVLDGFEQAKEFHKDTKWSLEGWKGLPFVTPMDKVPISERKIPFEVLQEALAPVLTPAVRLESSFSIVGAPEVCEHCFAFGWTYETAVYGALKDGVVDQLYFLDYGQGDHEVDLPALAAALNELGRRYRLILVDWPRHEIVNLYDGQAADYLREVL